jgi:hypothetical protein
VHPVCQQPLIYYTVLVYIWWVTPRTQMRIYSVCYNHKRDGRPPTTPPKCIPPHDGATILYINIIPDGYTYIPRRHLCLRICINKQGADDIVITNMFYHFFCFQNEINIKDYSYIITCNSCLITQPNRLITHPVRFITQRLCRLHATQHAPGITWLALHVNVLTWQTN